MNNDKRESFIKRAKQIHKGENIIYDNVIYINNRTPVKLYDADLKEDGEPYGFFWQTPYNHLRGQSHPLKKGLKISKSKRLEQEDVIKRCEEVHKGENLDYSCSVYVNMHTPMKIISHQLRPDGTEYGEFWQEPSVHLKGCTHPEIGKLKQISKQSSTTEEFIEKGKIIHCNDEFDYHLVEYVNNKTKVKIICNKCDTKGNTHGIFEIAPDNFLQGKGCPKCGNHMSKGEEEIVDFIKKNVNTIIEQRNHTLLNGKEIDIFLPEYKIGFEYNGLKWHSEEFNKDKYYHLNKKNECSKQGVKLFHVFEDEFLYHKMSLFAKINKILGNYKNLKIFSAKKCNITEIDNNSAKSFLENNHIQGYAKASVHLGAFYNNVLLSVMSFTKLKNNEWSLVRFATDINYNAQEICTKFINYFTKNYKFNLIKTFIDRRWEINADNNVYTKSGFIKDKILKPDYYYTNGHGERLNKFGFRRQTLHKKHGLPLSLPESKMAEQLGFYRIWDCGFIKYVYKP